MNIFLILGYGIPKKIERDKNYERYLGWAFNMIFSQSQKLDEAPVIVFCGGPTDVLRPYKRVESQEMARQFQVFANRLFCRSVTKTWQYLFEKKSLSTLENLMLAKQMLEAKNFDLSRVTIFCETTREGRIKFLAKKIFGRAKVVSIDFDLSENRYVDPRLVEEREQKAMELDEWALQSPQHLKAYHKVFVDKIAFLRKSGPGNHQAALRAWWKKRTDELN